MAGEVGRAIFRERLGAGIEDDLAVDGRADDSRRHVERDVLEPDGAERRLLAVPEHIGTGANLVDLAGRGVPHRRRRAGTYDLTGEAGIT